MIHAGSEPTSPLRYMRCECDVGFLPILHAFAPPLLRAPRAYPSSPPHASPPRFVPPLPRSFVHAPPQPRTTPRTLGRAAGYACATMYARRWGMGGPRGLSSCASSCSGGTKVDTAEAGGYIPGLTRTRFAGARACSRRGPGRIYTSEWTREQASRAVGERG